MTDTATKPQDWLVRQLNQFTRDTVCRGKPFRQQHHDCADRLCGDPTCRTCFPQTRRQEYDDSQEPGFT